MVQRGLSSFRPTDVILTHERKVWKHEAKLQVHKVIFTTTEIFGYL